MIGAYNLAKTHFEQLHIRKSNLKEFSNTVIHCALKHNLQSSKTRRLKGKRKRVGQTISMGNAVDDYLTRGETTNVEAKLIGDAMKVALAKNGLKIRTTQQEWVHEPAKYSATCDLVCETTHGDVVIVECKTGYDDDSSMDIARIQACLQSLAYAAVYSADPPQSYVLRCREPGRKAELSVVGETYQQISLGIVNDRMKKL